MRYSMPPARFRCCKPAVTLNYDRLQTSCGQSGAIHLIALPPGATASTVPSEHVEQLLSNPRNVPSKAVDRLVSLNYREIPLTENLGIPSGSHAAVSLAFPGGFVDPSQFFVWERVQDLSLSTLEYLVLVQQPLLSPFEQTINERLGDGLEEINRDTARKCEQSGMKTPFVLVEDSWAVGGFLALRRILDWKRARLQPGGSVQ